MEDVFWSSIPEHDSSFLIPDYKEGLQFAFDRKPELALKLNNNKLPFGCHGFEKPKVRAFWNRDDALVFSHLHVSNAPSICGILDR